MPRRPPRRLHRDLIPVVLGLSRCIPPAALLALRPVVARGLHAHPSLRRRVAEGMAAAVGAAEVPPDAPRRYFEHVADLVAYSILTLRLGFRGAGLADQFDSVASEHVLREAISQGTGAILIAPHLVCHEIAVARAAVELPVTVMARHSSDPAHEERKALWYRATGVEIVFRPRPGAVADVREMSAAIEAIRRNHVLGITPDLLQSPGRGVAVTLFDRTAYLPAGAAYLARRTGAPLLPYFFWRAAGRYQMECEGPIEVDPDDDSPGQLQAVMQEWARRFEQFIRLHPDMWLFWLDKRWGAWLRETAPATGGSA